jgi:S-adenosylmethionine synthetase
MASVAEILGSNTKSLPEGHFLFTSESVGEGHPDKLCDQISDAILDACLKTDPDSKVDCIVSAKRNKFYIVGEIIVKGHIDITEIVRDTVKNAGFDDTEKGLDYKDIEINLLIPEASPEEETYYETEDLKEEYLDVQGLMFGYATAEWDEETLLPLSHYLASRICERLSECRKHEILPWLRPDCKSQVTVEYKKEGNIISPVRVHNILISSQHNPDISIETIREAVIENVIKEVVPENYLDENTTYYVNPSKSFTVGGPMVDSGSTGGKIIVDTYGGWAPHGGGSFSGKDPSKIERSGAYYARYAAKSLVKNKLCHRALVQVSYTLGLPDPLAVNVETFGTTKEGLSEEDITWIVRKNFNFRLKSIMEELRLKEPIYGKTAVFGHFGRCEPEFHWEVPKEDLVLE